MTQEEQPNASRNVVVRSVNGLHMRPAEILSRAAAQFESRIEIERGSLRVDATSIFDLITLAAEEGAELVLRAEGPDAQAAVDSIAQLFENDFENDTGPTGEATT